MPEIVYEDWKPGRRALETIAHARTICEDYQAQGYDLTLRQLYYQFVARDLIPNTDREYKRLGSVINKARMAGWLDWDYIVDRTRNLQSLGHWGGPEDIIRAASQSFRIDRWATQPTRVEVWVEKEALAGVVEQVAQRHDVAYFSCRGYVSQSEQWGAAQRLRDYIQDGQNVVVIHLGDHDPSGIDMTRDIRDRIEKFILVDWYREVVGPELRRGMRESGDLYEAILADMREVCDGREPLTINRIALNWDQVQQYSPPPNPAKMTDSRAPAYVQEFGNDSWELDALDPATLDTLIEDAIFEVRDVDAWDAMVTREREGSELLGRVSEHWEGMIEALPEDDDEEPDQEDED